MTRRRLLALLGFAPLAKAAGPAPLPAAPAEPSAAAVICLAGREYLDALSAGDPAAEALGDELVEAVRDLPPLSPLARDR